MVLPAKSRSWAVAALVAAVLAGGRLSLAETGEMGVLTLDASAIPATAPAVRAAKPAAEAEAPRGPEWMYRHKLLDERSRYGQFWFPEPLRGPEMDVDREIRVDWFHGEGKDSQVDEVEAELEYNIGMLTLELEVPYESERESELAPDGTIEREGSHGIGNIELSARHPIYQYVSPNEFFDYTLVGAFEVAIPSGSKISEDTEIVPKLYQLMRFGEHFSTQLAVGYSTRIGPNEGGESALEYDAVFGWNIEHEELPIPGTSRLIPIFELNGERGLSKDESGHNELFGTAGFRVNLDSIGPLQPRLGFGYVFPIDKGARDALDWGTVVSVVFEY